MTRQDQLSSKLGYSDQSRIIGHLLSNAKTALRSGGLGTSNQHGHSLSELLLEEDVADSHSSLESAVTVTVLLEPYLS